MSKTGKVESGSVWVHKEHQWVLQRTDSSDTLWIVALHRAWEVAQDSEVSQWEQLNGPVMDLGNNFQNPFPPWHHISLWSGESYLLSSPWPWVHRVPLGTRNKKNEARGNEKKWWSMCETSMELSVQRGRSSHVSAVACEWGRLKPPMEKSFRHSPPGRTSRPCRGHPGSVPRALLEEPLPLP